MRGNGPETEQEKLQIVLEVTDQDTLQQLMHVLKECRVSVKTKTITHANLSDQTTANIELDILTEKQRDTLELALKEGYYERPRNADLNDLSEILDISKSAVSQRLRSAETKLIKTALGQYL